MAIIPKNYARLESGYREKALKIYPWVCGRCSREFVYSNLRELTVHHIDHDHTNNPEDGSNWELLCLYCHDHEHSKYTDAVTGNCFVSIATIMSIRNIPKRISMVRPLSQGKMRRKMSVKRSTTHSLT